MRVVLNISAVLVCGALAGISALAQSAPSRAASVPEHLVSVLPSPADPADVLIRASGSSVEAHFAAANTTHDGHLTKEQAQQGNWPRVLKHFDEIDGDHNGWISADQIHAFNKMHHKHRSTGGV